MWAEIIAVGTELTTGAKLDTNSQWLSVELSAIGLPVLAHVTIADDLAVMVETLRTAWMRSDVVLISGGLGPTLDDLTRQALADLAGVPLDLHEPSLEHVKAMFARRKRAMPERNVVQAMFPRGSEPIANPRGTAPGIWMTLPRPGDGQSIVFAAMPGVPSELKPMFHESVRPRLPGGQHVILRAKLHCFGIGESDCEKLLGEVTARGRDPEVGITAHEATITLRIEAVGSDEAECRRKIDATKTEIREKLGETLFGEEEEELEDVLVRMLRRIGRTVSVAESGTGGLLSQRLTSVAGFDEVFRGGVIVPSDVSKQQLLDVTAHVLETAGAVSAETAGEMAIGCRRRFDTDFALAITEAPAYDPHQTDRPVPSVFLALAGPELLQVQEQVLLGDLTLIRSRAAKGAMNLLRRHLMTASRPTE